MQGAIAVRFGLRLLELTTLAGRARTREYLNDVVVQDPAPPKVFWVSASILGSTFAVSRLAGWADRWWIGVMAVFAVPIAQGIADIVATWRPDQASTTTNMMSAEQAR
ncbi:MAG: hypothetical protein ACR2P0_08310 [Acidimicrobiales bacterium]